MIEQGKAGVASATDIDEATARDVVEPATSRHQKEPRPKKARVARSEEATDEEAPDSQGKGRDKALEVEQLYTLMTPYAKLQGRSTYLYIPLDNGQALPCKLTTVKREGERARVWAFSKYRETYGRTPLVQTFNDACVKLQAALLVKLDTVAGSDETNDQKRRVPEEVERDNAVKDCADWTEQAVDVRATYARVPLAHSEHSGLWRLDGKKTSRLTDGYVQVQRVIRPSGASKEARYSSLVLKFTNRDGHEKALEVTDDQFTSNELANKLSVFCTYPEEERNRRFFLEAVKALARHEGVAVQEQTETLGYQKLENGATVWATSTGVETVDGFIESAEAPCLAPALPSTGNGYHGMAILPEALTPDVDYWQLLLTRFAPHEDVAAILLAMMSLSTLVMLPEGIAPEGIGVENGTLRLTPDIVGESRHGKSRALNAVLSLFGTAFYWNTSPLTTSVGGGRGDTGPGRNSLMSMMSYHLWVDYDHKDKPGNSNFEAQHKNRSDTIENYVDGATGGTTSSRSGRMRRRGVPAGCCVRTCNYDHALMSIDEGKDMIEARACTFVWPKGVKGNDTVSRLLDAHRVQAYAMGQELRRWYMLRKATEPERFKDDVAAMYDVARALVNEGYEWAYDHHRNHAEMLVLGTLLLMDFLQTARPGYWLTDWIDRHTTPLIENRVARSQFIKRLVEQKEEEKGLDVFVTTALRKHFSTQMIYLRSQKDALLTEEELEGLPFTLKDVGYRSVIREGYETWESGRQCIGYLVHKNQDMALSTDLLMELLKAEASKKSITLGSEQHVLSLLIEKGVVIPDVDTATGKVKRYEQQVRVAGKAARYLIVPTSMLFAAEVVTTSEDEDEDETPYAPPASTCIHCGSSLPSVSQVVKDTLVWVCPRCRKPRSRTTPFPDVSTVSTQHEQAIVNGVALVDHYEDDDITNGIEYEPDYDD